METQIQQQREEHGMTPEGMVTLEGASAEDLPMLPPADENHERLRLIQARISHFYDQLPQYFSRFFNQYKQLFIILAWILATIVALKVAVAVFNAINDIPLVSPILELIGIGYAIWFVSRYLVTTSGRQEVANQINHLKQQIVGDNIS
jgi:hypothetical protein